jgi:cyclic pyranopterin phosphate synthase
VSALVQLGPASRSFPHSESGQLVDTFGRLHSDLRISVTDRCNIRCFYCMPETGAEFAPISSFLTFREIERLVRVAVPLGIRKIRLTGGEPLLRPKLPDLISVLSRIDGIQDLALTTNAVILAEHAKALYEAGLRRLNVHLDTLDRDRFRQISRRDDLPKVLAGIEAARKAGFRSIKLNAVAVKNLSEPDLIPLVRFARERKFEVRFIEFMPLDAQEIWSLDQVLTADDMIHRLEAEFGPLTAVPDADPRAPATQYQFENGDRVGFIASVSRPFCLNCNRLRLTSDGKLRNCLFAQDELDVKRLLKGQGTDEEIADALRASVWAKWIGHEINRSTFKAPQRPMYSIGG